MFKCPILIQGSIKDTPEPPTLGIVLVCTRIHCEVEEIDKRLLLRVRDHGPGISSKEARRLFRPFSKSAQQAAHSAPGVGLGLALSRRLARSLGGDLRLEKAIGEGTCFVLSLPAAGGSH